mmetsp:Transcript_7145/g.14610  ORF Transcript_7145/g.14610 Transcript_7145/m.14610 type:complete len:219 (+) Transcript_7145:206-862(+)
MNDFSIHLILEAESLFDLGDFFGKVETVAIDTEGSNNISERRFGLLESFSRGGGPQDFDGGSLRGDGSDTASLDLETGTRQQIVLEVAKNVVLSAVIGVARLGNRLRDLEVLIHVGSLLRDGLDEGALEQRLVGLADVVYVSLVGIQKECGGVSLGVFTGLDGTVFSVDVVRGELDDPRKGVCHQDQQRESVLSLSVDLEEGFHAAGDIRDGGQSVGL